MDSYTPPPTPRTASLFCWFSLFSECVMSEVPCRVKPDAQRSGFASPMDLQPNPHYSFRIRICFAREPKPEAPGAGVLYRFTVMLIVRQSRVVPCIASGSSDHRIIRFTVMETRQLSTNPAFPCEEVRFGKRRSRSPARDSPIKFRACQLSTDPACFCEAVRFGKRRTSSNRKRRLCTSAFRYCEEEWLGTDRNGSSHRHGMH